MDHIHPQLRQRPFELAPVSPVVELVLSSQNLSSGWTAALAKTPLISLRFGPG